ncbi:MAG: hypothetical protein ABL999_16725 [Pyrinomonadaceae bacterium]
MNKLFLLAAIVTLSATAFADVKIKTKQTMSGQTSENTTFIKGKRTRTEMMGGVLVTITQCDIGRDLQLNPAMKTYLVNLYDDAPAAGEPKTPDAGKMPAVPVTKGGTMFVTTTIKDTGERKQMFGFTARHIVQTIETETSPDACLPTKSKMEMDMWVIDAEFASGCTTERQYRPYKNTKSGGCQDKVVPKTIGSAKSGYPLWQKMTSFDANGKESFSTVSEVVELSKATLDQALFEAPSDYREVNDAAAMYTPSSSSGSGSSSGLSYGGDPYGAKSTSAPSSGMTSSIRNANSNPISASQTEAPANGNAKKAGTIRVGVSVTTTAVGEGITANDLSAAIQNTLGTYLKGTKIEIVPLEAKLAAALTGEAKEKECDFVLYASAAHKKGGGGGFGFGKMLGQVVSQTGIGHTGSVAGNIAGQVATTAIVTATSMSGNVKSKDELTLDLKVQSPVDNTSPLARQFKAKAKSDGDDIISTVVEQAAQAILDALSKS